jgi:hypothetical protein
MKKALLFLALIPMTVFAEDRAAIDAIDLQITALQKQHFDAKHRDSNVLMCPWCKSSHERLMAQRRQAESATPAQGAPAQSSGGGAQPVRPSSTGTPVAAPAPAPVVLSAAELAKQAEDASKARANAKRQERDTLIACLQREAARPSREAALSEMNAGKITKSEALKRMSVVPPNRAAVVSEFKSGKIGYAEASKRLSSQ